MIFGNKKSIGIDIADHTIEAVELLKSGPGIKIASTGRIKLSPGIVERGRIKDATKLAEAIKKMFKQARPNPIITTQVIFGLPESQVYIHTFTLKPGDKKERDNLIFKEAKTNIPVPKDDLVFSYRELYNDKDGLEIILVAASRNVVAEWQKFFKSLNVKVEFFDFEPLATFRGLSLPPPKAPVSIVDIGAVTTHIAIFDKIGLRYAYTINVAGEQFTVEIAKSLKKNHKEAEKLKKELGLSKPGEQVTSVLAKVLQPIAADIKKTFNYFSEQTGENVGETILVGGSSMLTGLADYFSSNLGIPTKIGKQTLFKSDMPLVYIEAIGLALRGLEEKWKKRDPAILPLPEARQTNRAVKAVSKTLKDFDLKSNNQNNDKKLRRQKLILLAVMIVGVLAILASYWYKRSQKAQQEAARQAQIEAIDAQIAPRDESK